MANRFCTECGKELILGDKFCINCGNKIEEEKEEVSEAENLPKQEGKVVSKHIKEKSKKLVIEKKKLETVTDTVTNIGQIIGNTAFAYEIAGEMVFTQQIPSTNRILSTIGPVKYLLNSVINIFKNLKEVFIDKKKLIPAIIMVIIWIALIILPILGIAGIPVRYLSFLTFGRGGIGQGLVRVIGGTLGKGIFAYFVTSIMLPIFSGRKPFKGIGGGIKTLFNSFDVEELTGLSPILLGGGIALIVYNFLTGSAITQNSMIGIIGFIIGLQGLSRKDGFLKGFIMSFTNKSSKKKHIDNSDVNKIIAGFTSGFALSIPLSTIGFSYTCYYIGVFFIGVAILVKVIAGKKKGVENA